MFLNRNYRAATNNLTKKGNLGTSELVKRDLKVTSFELLTIFLLVLFSSTEIILAPVLI